MSLFFLLDVFVAFFADFVIGHPDWLPRPEKFIEWIGKYVENIMRRIINIIFKKSQSIGEDIVRSTSKTYRNERIAGVAFVLVMTTLVALIVAALLELSMFIDPILFHAVNTCLNIFVFRSRELVAKESYKVFDALKRKGCVQSQNMLAAVIGIKTENLDEKEIIKRTVESTAEDTADRVISPIF